MLLRQGRAITGNEAGYPGIKPEEFSIGKTSL